jgi:hypothetical protein
MRMDRTASRRFLLLPSSQQESDPNSYSNGGSLLNQRDSQGCPWCLAAPETFEQHGDGRPRCGFCDAAIPISADWFERGEKIIV